MKLPLRPSGPVWLLALLLACCGGVGALSFMMRLGFHVDQPFGSEVDVGPLTTGKPEIFRPPQSFRPAAGAGLCCQTKSACMIRRHTNLKRQRGDDKNPRWLIGLACEGLQNDAQSYSRERKALLGRRTVGPLYAVIPTAFVMGPLSLLAALFPALLGGFQRRWLALLSVVSANSTLYVLYHMFQGRIASSWSGDTRWLWGAMALLALVGTLWAWRRHRRRLTEGDAQALLPRRGEIGILVLLCFIGAAFIVHAVAKGESLVAPQKELAVLWSVIPAGTLYALWLRRHEKRFLATAVPPTECAMLVVLVAVCAGLGLASKSQPASAQARVVWTFEPKDNGAIDSSPLLAGDRIYVSAYHRAGFKEFGAVYCIDRNAGTSLWKFDDGGRLRPVFSSPQYSDGKIFVGEGYHQDARCRLFCLEAATGAKVWECVTESHVESTPCIAGGRVYFGAGDDGIYCLDAKTGKKLWQFKGPHVDSSPAIANGRLYAGSGYGSHEVFCLDIETSHALWRVPLDLPAFAAPVVVNNRVYFGIGNGNLLASADKPEGAILCLDADTGRRLWRYDLPDAVHGKPVVQGHVYCGCRNGRIYCFDAEKGLPLWSQEVGGAIVTEPIFSQRAPQTSAALYVAAGSGHVCSLNPSTGQVEWTFDVAAHAQTKAQLLSTPLVMTGPSAENLLVFGASLHNLVASTARLYCIEGPLPR